MGPRILESGVVDILSMLDSVSLDPDESYYGFIDDVSDILQARRRIERRGPDPESVVPGRRWW